MDRHALAALGFDPAHFDVLAGLEPKELTPARVVAEHRDRYVLTSDTTDRWAVVSGRFRATAGDGDAWPAVGDWVAAQHVPDGVSVIHHVLPRRTRLERLAAGGVARSQVLAANVDVVFIVTSLNADYNPRRLERTLALVWESGARPVIVLTKADLSPDVEAATSATETLAIGVPVHAVCAPTGDGLDALLPYLGLGSTVALVGSSGVGKSTLVNALVAEPAMATREVRAGDDRGRHTTSHRQLVRVPTGGAIVDTPGLREVGLAGDDGGLDAVFGDIDELARSCRFADCGHQTEPGCAVLAAIASGEITSERLSGYRKLQREAAHVERRRSARARNETKRRWKRIHMAMRERKKVDPRFQ